MSHGEESKILVTVDAAVLAAANADAESDRFESSKHSVTSICALRLHRKDDTSVIW
jgi:hypothetical protein